MAPKPKKAVKGYINLIIPAGSATPAPPIGPACGQQGVNIKEFVDQFNERTKDLEKGMPIPVTVEVYADRSFTFTTRTAPASFMIKKATKLKSGSKTPGREVVAQVRKSQVKDIAQAKMKDLNANDIDAAMRIIEGTARSMGVEVVEG